MNLTRSSELCYVNGVNLNISGTPSSSYTLRVNSKIFMVSSILAKAPLGLIGWTIVSSLDFLALSGGNTSSILTNFKIPGMCSQKHLPEATWSSKTSAEATETATLTLSSSATKVHRSTSFPD